MTRRFVKSRFFQYVFEINIPLKPLIYKIVNTQHIINIYIILKRLNVTFDPEEECFRRVFHIHFDIPDSQLRAHNDNFAIVIEGTVPVPVQTGQPFDLSVLNLKIVFFHVGDVQGFEFGQDPRFLSQVAQDLVYVVVGIAHCVL